MPDLKIKFHQKNGKKVVEEFKINGITANQNDFLKHNLLPEEVCQKHKITSIEFREIQKALARLLKTNF